MAIIRSLLLFIVAGLAEIGGGWLVWQWLRNGRSLTWGLVGGIILFRYDLIGATIALVGVAIIMWGRRWF